MSFDALAWAGKAKPGSAPRKLVLLALADRHNTEDGLAWPSIKWLSEWTDLNRKTIITALQDLETAGLISDSGIRVGTTKQVKAYRLHLETVPKAEQSQKRNSSELSREQSQKRDADTVRNLGSEAKASSPKPRAKKSGFPPPLGVADQIWCDFLASPKRRKAGMSDTAYAGIVNNLEQLAEHGFPPGPMIALAVERGWTTVKLEWVQNDESYRRTNGVGRNQSSDGLSPTTRAALAVFGTTGPGEQRAIPR